MKDQRVAELHRIMLVQSCPSSGNIDASMNPLWSWHPPWWAKGSCAWSKAVPCQGWRHQARNCNNKAVDRDRILQLVFRCFSLHGVKQRRDQSETKGYSDPLPRWKFQHVHAPYTLTGVAWKRVETLFLLVSVSTVYTCHTARAKRPPHSARPQASQPLLVSRPWHHSVPSQSTRKDAVSSRWKIRHAQTVFPNNYKANKLTKESGTLTSGLLGRCITNSKGYHKGGTACPTDLRSTKIVFAQKTGGSW